MGGRRSVTEDASDVVSGVSPVMRVSPSICRVLTIDWHVRGLYRCLWNARGLYLCPCVTIPRGFTSVPTQEEEYNFPGFIPTNKQTNKGSTSHNPREWNPPPQRTFYIQMASHFILTSLWKKLWNTSAVKSIQYMKMWVLSPTAWDVTPQPLIEASNPAHVFSSTYGNPPEKFPGDGL